MARTLNQQLADAYLRRTTYLERVKTNEARKIVRLLKSDVYPAIEDVIDSRTLRADLDRILADAAAVLTKASTASTTAVGAAELAWQSFAVDQAIGVVSLTTRPSPTLIRSVVTSEPFQGDLLKDWFDSLSSSTATRVRRTVNIGLVEGKSVGEMVRDLRGTRTAPGVLDITTRGAEAIVRTATNHVTSRARTIFAEENDDLIKAERLLATLDQRTTLICMGYDGKVYPVNVGPRPPFHMNCRTTVVPVLKSYSELGIKLKNRIPTGTRASMFGEVPEKTTYGPWLKRQSAAFQDDTLGPARAKLFREGKLKVEQFAVDGRVLTLKELERKL